MVSHDSPSIRTHPSSSHRGSHQRQVGRRPGRLRHQLLSTCCLHGPLNSPRRLFATFVRSRLFGQCGRRYEPRICRQRQLYIDHEDINFRFRFTILQNLRTCGKLQRLLFRAPEHSLFKELLILILIFSLQRGGHLALVVLLAGLSVHHRGIGPSFDAWPSIFDCQKRV